MDKTNKTTIDQIKRIKARVTVITPTYNRADLIKHTMKSVVAQDYTDYVYIILDDGSRDDTEKVVLDFIKDKKNCFYLYHNNIGEAETVNIGWNLCKGEYFVQVNSDDTVEPNLLSEMVKVLDEKPEYVVAYPDFYFINKEGEIVEEVKNADWNFIDALSAFSCYAAAPGAFIRRSAFKHLDKIKDGKYKYINDVKMLWNMALTGDFIHITKTLASWRSHTEGISVDRYKSIGEVRAWADEYFSKKYLPKKVKECENKCRQSIDIYCAQLIENSEIEEVVSSFVKEFKERYQLLIGSNNELKSKNNELNDRNRYLEYQKTELLSEINDYEESRSWKITKPLRSAASIFKRLRSK